MAPGLQRATQGLAAVAVATTLVTVGLGVQKATQPVAAAESSAAEGLQAVPRPFVAPSGTAIAPGLSPSPSASHTELAATGLKLPTTVYQAYLNAQARLAQSQPRCRLTWPVLAGIGQVESNHARGGALDIAGNTLTPIIGPALNGAGFAAIGDTDDGRLDGDTLWDRAVGPMQFIPTTWAVWGTDGNNDGVASPHNMYDAALTTGRYLCANGRDLSVPSQLRAAILSYNQSSAYADTVTTWIARYTGAKTDIVPDASVSPSASRSPSASASKGPSPSTPPKSSTSPAPTPSTSGNPSPSPSPSRSGSPSPSESEAEAPPARYSGPSGPSAGASGSPTT
ncbi:hypothetical protein AB0D66_32480 [Streptomyces sp. NPDC048270]|uniref:lytic transglycosylase domain-containing protein n=1 Tax=Streptomyces sp. NPDC048270 TaxID=3154615 RepID=UPI0033C7E35C